jgi:SCY1-like protein 1
MDDDETAFTDAVDEQPKAPAKPTVSAKPFEDDGEPDFAGWLAAQAGKKTGSKPLPKGLAKPGSGGARPGALGAGSRKVSAAPAKPAVKKVIDTKPKEAGDDDGWGDGW